LIVRSQSEKSKSSIAKIMVPASKFAGFTNRPMEAFMEKEIAQADIDRAFPRVGAAIRTARKEGPCQYGRRTTGARSPCLGVIKRGDRYVAGPCNFVAGPWSRDRYCMGCVRAAIKVEDWLASLPRVA
jgi:hypothetical protein